MDYLTKRLVNLAGSSLSDISDMTWERLLGYGPNATLTLPPVLTSLNMGNSEAFRQDSLSLSLCLLLGDSTTIMSVVEEWSR